MRPLSGRVRALAGAVRPKAVLLLLAARRVRAHLLLQPPHSCCVGRLGVGCLRAGVVVLCVVGADCNRGRVGLLLVCFAYPFIGCNVRCVLYSVWWLVFTHTSPLQPSVRGPYKCGNARLRDCGQPSRAGVDYDRPGAPAHLGARSPGENRLTARGGACFTNTRNDNFARCGS